VIYSHLDENFYETLERPGMKKLDADELADHGSASSGIDFTARRVSPSRLGRSQSRLATIA
jgi:hypothetical protein